MRSWRTFFTPRAIDHAVLHEISAAAISASMTSRSSGPPAKSGQGLGQGATPRETETTGVAATSSSSLPVDPALVVTLGRTPLFKGFTDTGLQILASIAQEKSIPAGTPLFVENMIGDSLYVLSSGMIRVSVRGPLGRDVTLTIISAPESLGEAALLRGGPRLCSATAEVPSTVIEIARRDIGTLQRTKPQACLKLMMSVVDLIGVRMRASEPEFKRFLAWCADR